ncbi:L-rhamnose/proton symporter RhaT [Mucilaginibacter ginsenosidivorans]|uniref:L-rhamnose/proton symporter RhaT n=1 Tax=Mucilaginibacter ginsenosidivorans TaxID=398053 RepID=A0A5B8V271_9SPHI|nr:L-rhamnose/proton symporter RhaT [Mucilaginibacter ginsenosidivorans]QEC65259.1 L-rhamnose/proton symporter RhaT [Mucilaginibacter ginsenosidivorans]
MQALFGVIFHFIGGFASGSFYIPYKKVRNWAWESFWIVGGLFSWLIVPFIAAWLTVPGFMDIIRHASGSVRFYTYLFGVLWGIGGLTYGLGVRYLGVSLGSTIILGLCSIFGALIPSFYYDFYPKQGKDSFSMMLHSHWGQMVLLGVLVCVLGIVICGKAGTMKERELSKGDVKSHNAEYKFGLGLFVSIISGVLSACFAFGIDAGKDMANVANEVWKSTHAGQGEFLFQNNVTYIVILLGGLTTNFIWCMVLNARNRTFGNYTDGKTPLAANYLFSALAGTTWFMQFFFYGMGESRLGNGASSWILHMAFIILTANLWGLVLKEWKGVSRKAMMTVIAGIATIMLSVLIVGYGNSIK